MEPVIVRDTTALIITNVTLAVVVAALFAVILVATLRDAFKRDRIPVPPKRLLRSVPGFGGARGCDEAPARTVVGIGRG